MSFNFFGGLRGRKSPSVRWGMDSPLIESFKYFFAKNIVVTLMTLLPSSIECIMGLWEEQPSSLPSFKGLDVIWMKVPLSSGSGSLSHSTAHQMRDVIPNRWWERWALWKGTLDPFRAGRRSVSWIKRKLLSI